MCDPISLASAGTAVAGGKSILSFLGQNAASAANTRAANLSYANTSNQLAQRSSQIDAQESQNTVQAMIDRVTAQGRISASASSMGSDTATTTREGSAANFSVGRALGIEDTNSQNQRQDVGNQLDNAFYARQTQENQVLPGNPISLALGLGGDAVGGAGDYLKLGGQFPGASPDAGMDTTSYTPNPSAYAAGL